ncbi:MAG: class I SAM-dependent methyltransferase [Salinivirgaceae bacterium]
MKNRIKKLIPISIKKFLYARYLYKIKEENRAISEKIPKYCLKPEHVQHLKVLADRQELLKYLPQEGIVAELGVDQGEYSAAIYKINKPKKFHLIDAWDSSRYNKQKQELVETMFAEQLSRKDVEINLGLSTEIVHSFDDQYFDWIYIDTDHSYKVTKEELELWGPKIKQGGVIAGHDFIIGNWNEMKRYGVIEAVQEFCVNYNWELVYLTAEFHKAPSFAIKKT